MSKLPPVPYQAPLVDMSGYPTQAWRDWFQKVFIRTGGTEASTNDELAIVSGDQIVDASITAAKLAAAIAGNGLSGGAGSSLAVNVDGSTLEIVSDTTRVKDLGITDSKLAGSITFAKLLSSDWISSAGASGYVKIGSGIMIQWGVTISLASATTTTITLPASFATACRQVITGIQGNSAASTALTGQWGTGNYTTSSFDLYNRTSGPLTFNFIAVGN